MMLLETTGREITHRAVEHLRQIGQLAFEYVSDAALVHRGIVLANFRQSPQSRTAEPVGREDSCWNKTRTVYHYTVLVE